MQHNRRTRTSDRSRNKVLEIALDRPHKAFVAGHHLCGQSTFAAPLHLQEIARLKARFCVPHVYVAQSLVAQKYRRAIVGAQQNDWQTLWFRSNVDDGPSAAKAFAQMFGAHRKQARRAQIREI